MLHQLNKSRLAPVFLAALMILGELFLFSMPVQADPGQPGPYGRRLNYGYFFDRYDGSGGDVFAGGLHVSNVDQLVNAVRARALNIGGGWSLQERRGAAFIVQTMRGGGYSLPGVAEVNDWEQRVRFVNSYGGIKFNEPLNFSINSYYQDAHGDDAFFTLNSGQYIWRPGDMYDGERVGNSIAFERPDGTLMYAIRRACANPVGNPVPLPRFTISGQSTVNVAEAAAGTVVNFAHNLRNSGPDSWTVDYTVWHQPPSGLRTRAPAGAGRSNPGSIRLNSGNNLRVNENFFTIPANATPGQQFCQYVTFDPTSSSNAGASSSSPACVVVPYNYDLRPTATITPTVSAPNQDVTASYAVTNTGVTASRSTGWGVHELVVQPGVNIDTGPPFVDNASCATYVKPGVTCRTITTSPGQAFPPGTTALSPGGDAVSFNVGDAPAGSRICRILSVNDPTQAAAPVNRWGRPSCVTIAKYPTVHFMGGDVSVGNPFKTFSDDCSLLANTGNIYTTIVAPDNGSVVEYAAFVRGLLHTNGNYGFGTGSQPSTPGRLAFANTSAELGSFGSGDCMTDYYARYSAQLEPESMPGPAVSFGGSKSVRYSNDEVFIDASAIANGSRVLVVVDGNVTINGNITYTGNYANSSEVPSFALIANGNITIRAGATQLDGIYFSKSTINTCDHVGPLNNGLCNQQLTVNGAIMTKGLDLRRTFGGDGPERSQPAEKFNLSTELFFNNMLDDSPPGRINTVEQRDLPPRFE